MAGSRYIARLNQVTVTLHPSRHRTHVSSPLLALSPADRSQTPGLMVKGKARQPAARAGGRPGYYVDGIVGHPYITTVIDLPALTNVSVRDYHLPAARRGGISGCSVDWDRRAVPWHSYLGVEIHGDFRGCTEASGVGGEIREISGLRAFRGAILQARTGVGEHFLLLGETAENAPGLACSGGPAAAGCSEADGWRQHARGRGAVSLEVRHGSGGPGRLSGDDPLPGRVSRGGGRRPQQGVPGSRREGVRGESTRCSPRRCCLPWGRRRSTSTGGFLGNANPAIALGGRRHRSARPGAVYIVTSDSALTTPLGGPKINIYSRQGKVAAVCCDQPAKILEVETQDDPRRAEKARPAPTSPLVIDPTQARSHATDCPCRTRESPGHRLARVERVTIRSKSGIVTGIGESPTTLTHCHQPPCRLEFAPSTISPSRRLSGLRRTASP